jgi:hypothetical protein
MKYMEIYVQTLSSVMYIISWVTTYFYLQQKNVKANEVNKILTNVPEESSDKTCAYISIPSLRDLVPDDEDRNVSRNVGFMYETQAADSPRELHRIQSPRKLQAKFPLLFHAARENLKSSTQRRCGCATTVPYTAWLLHKRQETSLSEGDRTGTHTPARSGLMLQHHPLVLQSNMTPS